MTKSAFAALGNPSQIKSASSFGQWAKDKIDGAYNAGKGAIDSLYNAGANAATTLDTEGLGSVVKNTIDSGYNASAGAINNASNAVNSAAEAVAAPVYNAYNTAANAVGDAVNTGRNSLITAGRMAVNNYGMLPRAIGAAIQGGQQGSSEGLGSAAKGAIDAFGQSVDDSVATRQGLLEDLRKGVVSNRPAEYRGVLRDLRSHQPAAPVAPAAQPAAPPAAKPAAPAAPAAPAPAAPDAPAAQPVAMSPTTPAPKVPAPTPIASTRPTQAQLAAFRRGTASQFDPNSRVDRAKMQALMGGQKNWAVKSAFASLGHEKPAAAKAVGKGMSWLAAKLGGAAQKAKALAGTKALQVNPNLIGTADEATKLRLVQEAQDAAGKLRLGAAGRLERGAKALEESKTLQKILNYGTGGTVAGAGLYGANRLGNEAGFREGAGKGFDLGVQTGVQQMAQSQAENAPGVLDRIANVFTGDGATVDPGVAYGNIGNNRDELLRQLLANR